MYIYMYTYMFVCGLLRDPLSCRHFFILTRTPTWSVGKEYYECSVSHHRNGKRVSVRFSRGRVYISRVFVTWCRQTTSRLGSIAYHS